MEIEEEAIDSMRGIDKPELLADTQICEVYVELYNDETGFLSDCLWDEDQLRYAIKEMKKEYDTSDIEENLQIFIDDLKKVQKITDYSKEALELSKAHREYNKMLKKGFR